MDSHENQNWTKCPACDGTGWRKRGKLFGPINCTACNGHGRVLQVATNIEEPGA